MDHRHLHRRHAQPLPDDLAAVLDEEVQQTLVSIVYVTASPTFTGAIGGYTTLGVVAATTATPDTASTTDDPVVESSTSTPTTAAVETTSQAAETKSSSAVESSIVDDTSTSAEPVSSSIVADSSSQTTLQTSSSTGVPSSIVPTSSVAATLAIAVASSSLASSSAQQSSTLSSTASAASSSSSASPSSGGMSDGGKAGLAIGLLLLFGAALSICLFLFKKRKNAAMKAERLDDEKTDLFAGGRSASTRTNATAPRLSVRQVSQFLPNFGGEKRTSRGNVLAMASSPTSQTNEKTSAWERPTMSQDTNRNNPFGNHAETIDATNANGPAVVDSVGPGGEIVSGAAAAPVSNGIGLARRASKRENQSKQLDFTKGGPFKDPPSPSGSQFSLSSDSPSSQGQTPQGIAIAAAGGPSNSVVHRVQLDFKPSMEDEIELRAGQLIRLLHEYDDGWALCIRLDRSKQGVCPRTCLSTRPVKPRPQQNGPRGPPPAGMRVPQQNRQMSPQDPQGRPMSPAMSQDSPRSMSPASGRSMTPQGGSPQKSMTPQQGRPRSPSAAQTQGRVHGPPGPSPMNPFAQSTPQFELAAEVPQPELAAEVPQPELAADPTLLSRSPPSDGPISRKPVGQAL